MMRIETENYQSTDTSECLPLITITFFAREAFRRVLVQLCGFISGEEWNKVCKMYAIRTPTLCTVRSMERFTQVSYQ